MARTELRAGASLDLLNQTELRSALSDARAEEYAWLRGIKHIRLPIMTGTASGSAITLGGDTSVIPQTPAEGHKWAITHLVIEGMTASSSAPDVLNVKIGPRIVWQLNGNQFAQVFTPGQLMINPGEALSYVSVGTFASTSLIIAHGSAWDVPAEMAGKLL